MAAGLVRAIGVSNFGERHLRALLAHRPRIPPAVNQIERHPYLQQPGLRTLCEAEGIRLVRTGRWRCCPRPQQQRWCAVYQPRGWRR